VISAVLEVQNLEVPFGGLAAVENVTFAVGLGQGVGVIG
jgi:ABC-type branched-subunit amino acid transport system ATPase component